MQWLRQWGPAHNIQNYSTENIKLSLFLHSFRVLVNKNINDCVGRSATRLLDVIWVFVSFSFLVGLWLQFRVGSFCFSFFSPVVVVCVSLLFVAPFKIALLARPTVVEYLLRFTLFCIFHKSWRFLCALRDWTEDYFNSAVAATSSVDCNCFATSLANERVSVRASEMMQIQCKNWSKNVQIHSQFCERTDSILTRSLHSYPMHLMHIIVYSANWMHCVSPLFIFIGGIRFCCESICRARSRFAASLRRWPRSANWTISGQSVFYLRVNCSSLNRQQQDAFIYWVSIVHLIDCWRCHFGISDFCVSGAARAHARTRIFAKYFSFLFLEFFCFLVLVLWFWEKCVSGRREFLSTCISMWITVKKKTKS